LTCPRGEQSDGELRAFSFRAHGLDHALVILDDAQRDRETEPRAVTRLFRGEKRREEFLGHVRRESFARVGNLDDDRPARTGFRGACES